MRVIQPQNRPVNAPRPWIFVAGSIEMGTAEDWQARLVGLLKDFEGTLWNPRRDDWDPTWEQRASNPRFAEQVNWELDMIGLSDGVVMYFDPATKSPITLLELGLLAANPKLFVCCPDGFWRKGNVEIVCERYHIPLLHTFDDLVAKIRGILL